MTMFSDGFLVLDYLTNPLQMHTSLLSLCSPLFFLYMPRRYYKKTWNYYLHIHCTWRNMHRKTWKNIKLKCISIGFQTTYEFGNEQVCKTKKSNLISIHWKDVYNFNCHTVNPAQLCSGNCRHETRLCAYGPAWPIKAMRCDYLKKHHTLTWHTHTNI